MNLGQPQPSSKIYMTVQNYFEYFSYEFGQYMHKKTVVWFKT